MTDAWRNEAACRGSDPSLFFPGQGEETHEAKRLCARCPVREQCLDLGLGEKYGIWGGTSERERRTIRRYRRREVA